MPKLYCYKIDNDEIKTTKYGEVMKFIRRHKGKINLIIGLTVEVPQARLQHVIDNVSVEELNEWWRKKNNIPKNELYVEGR